MIKEYRGHELWDPNVFDLRRRGKGYHRAMVVSALVRLAVESGCVNDTMHIRFVQTDERLHYGNSKTMR